MSLKLAKCLVCRLLFKLGLIKACKAPPLPTVESPKSKKSSKKSSKKN